MILNRKWYNSNKLGFGGEKYMISIKEKPYYKTTIESVIGEITLGSDGQRYFADTVPNEMLPNDNLNIFAITKDWLNRYFEGKKPQISELPLAPIGGEFRQTVWKMLTEIPYGKVITYGELAQKNEELKECLPKLLAEQ